MKVIAFSCNENGEDCVGTDSYFPCDGRWNVSTCISKAKEHYNKFINKPYGFRLCSGTILNHKYISNIIKL